LAMVGPHVLNASGQRPTDPVHGDGATVSGSGGVLQANFSAPLGGGVLPQDTTGRYSSSPFARAQAR